MKILITLKISWAECQESPCVCGEPYHAAAPYTHTTRSQRICFVITQAGKQKILHKQPKAIKTQQGQGKPLTVVLYRRSMKCCVAFCVPTNTSTKNGGSFLKRGHNGSIQHGGFVQHHAHMMYEQWIVMQAQDTHHSV